VEFDGVPASGCTTVNASNITCTGTPAHLPASVNVRVRNPDTRTGYLPANYLYTTGIPRGITITKITKSGVSNRDAVIAWSCAGGACDTLPTQLYRSQNAALKLNVEHTPGSTGASGVITDAGTLAAGRNPSYFWIME
jgi:hypothetical protein